MPNSQKIDETLMLSNEVYSSFPLHVHGSKPSDLIARRRKWLGNLDAELERIADRLQVERNEAGQRDWYACLALLLMNLRTPRKRPGRPKAKLNDFAETRGPLLVAAVDAIKHARKLTVVAACKHVAKDKALMAKIFGKNHVSANTVRDRYYSSLPKPALSYQPSDLAELFDK